VGLLLLVTIGIILYNIFMVKYLRKNEIQVSKLFIVGMYMFSYYLWAVLSITGPGNILDIGSQREIIISLIPFKWQMENMFGLITNTILFIPLGVLLPSLWKKFESFSNTILTGFGLSLIIEILQLLNIRATDIDDLIMNTLGTIIGYIIYSLLFKKFTSKFKLKNNTSDNLFIKYNAEIFISTIISLNFFIAPFIDKMIYRTIFGL
jgi:glycopeptide antibiotics resistance protein